jgi:hypothetical protein
MTSAGSLTGFQATVQFGPTEQLGQPGQPLTDFMAGARRHHHHHGGCGEGGQPWGGQRNGLGQELMQDGQQLVRDGQRLIEQGDSQDGMQLVDEGAQLEMQGAALEAQSGPPTMPGGPMMPMGGSDPCNGGQYGSPFPTGMNGYGNNRFAGGYGQNCGCGGLSVNGNTVNTGEYTIDASTANSGTLTVTDNCTGQSFKVWGDPHIDGGNGQTADFQHAPATFRLPDGTEINVNPTNNPGVNTINNVTITKGNDAVTMTGFTGGNIQTQHLPGEGYYLDATTPQGTAVTVQNGDQLTVNGQPISGNIDQYASNGPMGYGTYGNGIQTNGGNIAQYESIIAQAEQAIAQILQGSAVSHMTNFG